jgi:hypothetical protein
MHIFDSKSEDGKSHETHCSEVLVQKTMFPNETKAVPYFVRSAENYSDGMTKNLPDKLYKEHLSVLTEGRLPYRREDVRKAIELIESNDSSGFKYRIPCVHSGATGEQGPIKGPTSEAKEVRVAVIEPAESIGSLVRSK